MPVQTRNRTRKESFSAQSPSAQPPTPEPGDVQNAPNTTSRNDASAPELSTSIAVDAMNNAFMPEGETLATPEAAKERKGRSTSWLPWQDRELVEAVLLKRPFNCYKDTANRWDQIADHLSQLSPEPIVKTSRALQGRLAKIMEQFARGETLSRQSTGTNEKVDAHIEKLTEIAQLIRDAKDTKNSEAEKRTLQDQVGEQMLAASVTGRVDRDSLLDVTELAGSSTRDKQAQRRKKRRSDSSDDGPSAKRLKKEPIANIVAELKAESAADEEALKQSRKEEKRRHKELLKALKKGSGDKFMMEQMMVAQAATSAALSNLLTEIRTLNSKLEPARKVLGDHN